MSTLEDRIDAYVLDHMNEDERARFEIEMARDAGLGARVARLRQRLVALDETAERLAPSEELWTRIAREVDIAPAAGKDTASSPAPLGRPAWPWRNWVVAASVLVALGVGFLGGTAMREAPPAPIVIAVLADDALSPGAIIEAYGDDRVRIVPLEAFAAGANQVLEVWTLPSQADGPVSLGTFDAATELVLEGPDLPTPESGQLYEITLEPAGGSPIGRPTGPILYKGFATAPVI